MIGSGVLQHLIVAHACGSLRSAYRGENLHGARTIPMTPADFLKNDPSVPADNERRGICVFTRGIPTQAVVGNERQGDYQGYIKLDWVLL